MAAVVGSAEGEEVAVAAAVGVAVDAEAGAVAAVAPHLEIERATGDVPILAAAIPTSLGGNPAIVVTRLSQVALAGALRQVVAAAAEAVDLLDGVVEVAEEEAVWAEEIVAAAAAAARGADAAEVTAAATVAVVTEEATVVAEAAEIAAIVAAR